MRRPMLLASLIVLAIASPAHAFITLEYWSGIQDFTPYNPAAPNSANPQTLQGLRNWDFSGQSKLNSLTVQSGQQFIVKVVLRDHDSVGNGSGYTLSGANSSFLNDYGLNTFAFKFGYVPGTLDATRDTNPSDGKAQTATVWQWNGAGGSATAENYNFAAFNFGTDYFTLANLFFDSANGNGVAPFQQANGDVLYPLANVVLTAGTPATGALSLTRSTTSPPTFGALTPSGNIVSYDNALWGSSSSLASLSFTVTPAPEPSSFLLGSFAAATLAWRRRKLEETQAAN